MDPNTAVRSMGLPYLWSTLGGIHILEQLLNITAIIFMFLSGFCLKSYLFCGVVTLAFLHTLTFMILHMKGVIRRSRWSWHWIECGSTFTVAVLLAILSSVVLSEFIRSYIVTGIVGYITAILYFFDTFQKYQIAITPVPKYAWTTPNMPDLNY